MIYDCIVVGAGPGGLSASIYLGRAHKKTLLIYSTPMRTAHAIHIDNYLGFDSITGSDLIEKGLKQAKGYGVEVLVSTVRSISKEDVFKVVTSEGVFSSKYVIVASGVLDIFPEIDNMFEFIGLTLTTCPVCDGYRMTDKNVFIIGNGDDVARNALAINQLYTDKVTLCTGKDNKVSSAYMSRLKRDGVFVLEKSIVHLNGDNGIVDSVVLDDGSVLPCEFVYSSLGRERNDSFLAGLDLRRNQNGYIEVDNYYESSIKGLFVVGPLNTGPDQVSIAAGQGAVAANKVISSEYKLEA